MEAMDAGGDIESDSQKMKRTAHLHTDYSGLFENTQKHMLDFEDLELSQRNMDLQNISQKNGLLGEDEYSDNSQRRNLEEVDMTDALSSSQVLTVSENEFAMAFVAGGAQGPGPSRKFLDVPLELNTAQLSINEGGVNNGQNGFNDTINTEQENALLNFLATDGSDLRLSQGSLGLDSDFANFIEAEQESIDFNTNNEGLGSETISFENFGGPFSFHVVPIDIKGKSCFCIEYNKLYVDLGTYGFNVKLDFKEMRNPEKFVIRTALIFTDPQFQNVPVVKCVNCAETQKKLEKDDKEKSLIANHIVRGHPGDNQVTYVTSNKTNHSYMMIGLNQPEPGCSTLIQKLAFTCRSSCKSDETRGINRRATALVFTLLNNRRIVCGRSVINLRICSAPIRDFKAEYKEAAAAYQQRQGKKRTSAAKGRAKGNLQEARDADDEVVEPLPIKKSPCQKEGAKDSGTSPVCTRANQKQQQKEYRAKEADSSGPQAKVAKLEAQQNDIIDDGEPVPSTSTNSNSASGFDAAKAVETLYNSSQESSSQESIIEYEDEDKGIKQYVMLKTHYKECRKVLHWIKCPDPVQRAAAVQVFESLKFTENLCSKSKKMIKDLHTRSDTVHAGEKK